MKKAKTKAKSKAVQEAIKKESLFTAVYEKQGKWYVGYVEEIPGINTQGKTLAEAKKNLREALELILETNRILPFDAIHGLALKVPENPHPRFKTEDDLWKDDL